MSNNFAALSNGTVHTCPEGHKTVALKDLPPFCGVCQELKHRSRSEFFVLPGSIPRPKIDIVTSQQNAKDEIQAH